MKRVAVVKIDDDHPAGKNEAGVRELLILREPIRPIIIKQDLFSIQVSLLQEDVEIQELVLRLHTESFLLAEIPLAPLPREPSS